MNSVTNSRADEFEVIGSPFSATRHRAEVLACVGIAVVVGTMNFLAPEEFSGALNSAWQWTRNGIEIERAVNNCMSTSLLSHAEKPSK